jgi:hypothetical protein
LGPGLNQAQTAKEVKATIRNKAKPQTTAKPKPTGDQIKINGRVVYSQTSNPILLSRSAHMNEIIKRHHFHQIREIPHFSLVSSPLLRVHS